MSGSSALNPANTLANTGITNRLRMTMATAMAIITKMG
jgi:hypothetical protein